MCSCAEQTIFYISPTDLFSRQVLFARTANMSNRVIAHGAIAEIPTSVQNPRYLRSQAVRIYELKIAHNQLDVAILV